MTQFGVFQDYKWNNIKGLSDFNDKNILYGWNYSGKTTLSRLFHSIGDSNLNNDYNQAKFEVQLYDGNSITEENISGNELKVAVFNSDYIRDNLNWEPKEKWEPIAFDVGENIEKRKAIDELNLKITAIEGDEKSKGRIAPHKQNIDKFSQFENFKFTNQAKDIRHIVYNNTQSFDKGTFKRIKDNLGRKYKEHIITDSDEIKKLTKESNAHNTLKNIDPISFSPNFQKFKNSVKELLEKEPDKDVVIDILESSSELYTWVKTGLSFDENQQTCSFCNNTVSPDRIKKLNSYYSNASAELRERIAKGLDLIDVEIRKLNELNFPKSENDFIEKCREPYKIQMGTFSKNKREYISSLQHLKSELNRKLSGNIFTSLPYKETTDFSTNINQWIKNLNDVIDSHNGFIKNFDENRKDSREKLSNHLVAEYLQNEKFSELKKKSEWSTRWLSLYDKYVKRKQSEIDDLTASLKNITEGMAKLNELIKKFLNRDDIKIAVTDDDKFLLKRGDYNAKNLSEGEKTAIAFSYFLTQLESRIEDKSIFETIVFIDDPISSLDSNHIAQVYSLINSFFFRKGLDPDNLEKVCNCFEQFFISTHNFEFFTFLKDSTKLKQKKKKQQGDKKVRVPSCSYYLINREGKDQSVILPMSKPILNYKSEYVHLFDIIYKYQNVGQDEKDKYIILMPNAIRRFLEIYTLMKIPSEPASVESRIAQLVDDVNEYKTLNHFSHFTTFEKITKHDELIMNLPKATDELFNLLKKDNTHYNSLLKSIGENE